MTSSSHRAPLQRPSGSPWKGLTDWRSIPRGDLVLHLDGGEVRLKRTVSYQMIGNARHEVASAFQETGDGTIDFALSAYDVSRPFVIDPVLVYSTYLGGWRTTKDPGTLVYSTFLGGSCGDGGYAIAVDAVGIAM